MALVRRQCVCTAAEKIGCCQVQRASRFVKKCRLDGPARVSIGRFFNGRRAPDGITFAPLSRTSINIHSYAHRSAGATRSGEPEKSARPADGRKNARKSNWSSKLLDHVDGPFYVYLTIGRKRRHEKKKKGSETRERGCPFASSLDSVSRPRVPPEGSNV